MNRTAGVARMYLKDRLGWFYTPWMILGISFAVNLAIAAIADVPITTGGLASIYIYLLVVGIVSVSQTFPFAIGFSVRRRDYMLGTLSAIGGLGAAFSLLLVLLAKIEADWIAGWGVDLTFFDLAYLTDGGALGQWWAHFGFIMHLFMVGFLFGSIHRKLGRNGIFAVFTVLSVVLTIAGFLINYYERWDDIGRWIENHPSTAVELSTYLLPLTVLYALIAYGLLRKATV